jgi:hypothetical protein
MARSARKTCHFNLSALNKPLAPGVLSYLAIPDTASQGGAAKEKRKRKNDLSTDKHYLSDGSAELKY